MIKTVRRICHISTVHPTFDDRIFYKECLSLASNGYEVFLIVTHEADEKLQNVNIIALHKSKNRIHRIFINSVLAFFKTLVINPKVVHIHDPELLWMGLIFRLLFKKVIYDVHEDISKQILYKNWLGAKWIKVIVSKLVMYIEKFASLFFTRIIVVTEDIQNNFPVSKTILIRNFPRLDLIRNAKPAEITKYSIVVIYVGRLSKERGIYELISAMELINAELWLLGPWSDDAFERCCNENNGWHKTVYFGVKKLEEVYRYLKCADVGVAVLYPIKNYLTSLPVKAFEYMAMGVPMVISNFPYWEEFFRDAAFFANPNDPADIAGKINYIIANRSKANTIISNAINLIESEFSWEMESKRLLDLYAGLFTE